MRYSAIGNGMELCAAPPVLVVSLVLEALALVQRPDSQRGFDRELVLWRADDSGPGAWDHGRLFAQELVIHGIK